MRLRHRRRAADVCSLLCSLKDVVVGHPRLLNADVCVCECHLLRFAMSLLSDGRWASVAGYYEYCIVIPVVLAVRH